MKLPEFGNNHHMNKFVEVLLTKPALAERYPNAAVELAKYKRNTDIVHKFEAALGNGTFGGPVFHPLIVNGEIAPRLKPGMEKLEGGGYAETRRNGLMTELFELRKQVVGYYDLRNIKVSERGFLDV